MLRFLLPLLVEMTCSSQVFYFKSMECPARGAVVAASQRPVLRGEALPTT